MGRTAVSKTVRRRSESFIPRQIKALAAKLGLCDNPEPVTKYPEPEEIFRLWEFTLHNYFDYNYSFSAEGIEIVGESPKCWYDNEYPERTPWFQVFWPPPDVDKPAHHVL